MKTLTATTIALLLTYHSAFAGLSECIELEHKKGSGTYLYNKCNKKLNVTYCVDNPKHHAPCRKGVFGMVTLSPGSDSWLPFTTGMGRIYWAACEYPDGATDWGPPGDHNFTCR